jgi:hypothetical protein
MTQDNLKIISEKAFKQSPKCWARIEEVLKVLGVDFYKATVRIESVMCGKKCKGCPHGPYMYVYWKQGGKTRKKYIGKVGK